MKQFANGMRVKVTSPGHPLSGEAGTVVRLRVTDNGAWVNMDRDIRLDLRSSTDEGDPRKNLPVLYPDQCEGADAD